MQYNIEWINTTQPVADYGNEAGARWELGNYTGEDICEIYTEQFEKEYLQAGNKYDVDDIGGLVVYARAGAVVAVYDYENFVGWVSQ